MIARITGRLEEVSSVAALIDVGGGICYEVLIPSCDVERLTGKLGQEILLHTIHYIDGDPSRGGQTPRLIGFLTEKDKAFFRTFTTVRGIGSRKALRSLARSVGSIAAAIAARDVVFLKALPEIGAKTAERIIAELHDKVDEFSSEISGDAAQQTVMSEPAEEAISVLVQLGQRRSEARSLVERVLSVAPELNSPEEIIKQAYKLRG